MLKTLRRIFFDPIAVAGLWLFDAEFRRLLYLKIHAIEAGRDTLHTSEQAIALITHADQTRSVIQ